MNYRDRNAPTAEQDRPTHKHVWHHFTFRRELWQLHWYQNRKLVHPFGSVSAFSRIKGDNQPIQLKQYGKSAPKRSLWNAESANLRSHQTSYHCLLTACAVISPLLVFGIYQVAISGNCSDPMRIQWCSDGHVLRPWHTKMFNNAVKHLMLKITVTSTRNLVIRKPHKSCFTVRNTKFWLHQLHSQCRFNINSYGYRLHNNK